MTDLVARMRNPQLEHGGTAAPRLDTTSIPKLMREAADEIERLRAGNADLVKTVEVLQERYAGRRNDALEEAAKVADGPINRQLYANDIGPFIAAAIRALKDKASG